jgi:DNA polymerase III subunit epsilon
VQKKVVRVPELVVGFDTETTGLDVANDRAISYGFCVYRFGRLVSTDHYFVIPDRPITEGARRVHGLSLADLKAKAATETVLSVEAGLARTIEHLRSTQAQGGYVVGANVARFDLEMLRRSAMSVLGTSLQDADFDLSLVRVIDVIEHDLAIEPRSGARPRRGLTHLCQYYGVHPGGHDALQDARAAVEVLCEQVVRNNAGQMPLDLGSERDASVEAI